MSMSDTQTPSSIYCLVDSGSKWVYWSHTCCSWYSRHHYVTICKCCGGNTFAQQDTAWQSSQYLLSTDSKVMTTKSCSPYLKKKEKNTEALKNHIFQIGCFSSYISNAKDSFNYQLASCLPSPICDNIKFSSSRFSAHVVDPYMTSLKLLKHEWWQLSFLPYLWMCHLWFLLTLWYYDTQTEEPCAPE